MHLRSVSSFVAYPARPLIPFAVLGVPYDYSLDTWSIGCTLYELFTGKILFPGRSNNHMLLLMMELKGKFNAKMVKKANFGEQYFDEMGAFESIERDRVSGSVSTCGRLPSSLLILACRRCSVKSTFPNPLEISVQDCYLRRRRWLMTRPRSFYPSSIFWTNVSC